MDFFQGLKTGDLQRRRWALACTAIIAAALSALLALGMVVAPAQAHEPYSALAWGNNRHGQLGEGTFSGPENCGSEAAACSTTPVKVSGLSGVDAVSAGYYFSLALLPNGTVMAWGQNLNGQLGNGNTTESDVPVAVKELTGVKAIAAGFAHGLALLENGTVMAWGENQGQLGDGTKTRSDVPVAVCAPAPEPCPGSHLSAVKAIAAGETHSVALLENGTVVAWGANGSGQLGNGTTTGSDVPVAVSGLSERVKAIAAGEIDSLALLENGTVAAWGANDSGQLGDGGETSSDVPVAVSGLTHVSAIAAGQGHHALALLENGSVTAWGLNNSGQLGDGTNEGPETCGSLPLTFACAKTPVAVHGLPGAVTAIAGGREHSLALTPGGAALAWGRNEQGRLGDGLSTGPEGCGVQGSCSKLPVEVCAEGAKPVVCSKGGAFMVDAKGVAGGGEHSLALVPLPPTVTAISPNTGPKGGGTKVTITGTELEEGQVRFGSAVGKNATVSNNGTTIEATAPAGTGTVDVTVSTPTGVSPTSSADQFHYAPPTVKKLSPRRGPASGGTSVTITGTNFAGVTAVKFGSANAASFKVNSEASITAVSPSGVKKTTVDVTVTTASGTSAIVPRDGFKYRR